MEKIRCGWNQTNYVIIEDDYLYFNNDKKNVAVINVKDYLEVYQIIKEMRYTYHIGNLKYRANVSISHSYFAPYRTQEEALKTNSLFISYECEQNKYYNGSIHIMDLNNAGNIHFDNGRGKPDEVCKLDLRGEDLLKKEVDQYLLNKEKVRCVIGGKEIYLSRESIEAFKKL